MSVEHTNIQLTSAQLRYIVTRAERAGITSEEFLQSLVPSADENGNLQVADPDNRETALQAAERLGLVGCVKGAPADLATNPKHMKGFGNNGSDPC